MSEKIINYRGSMIKVTLVGDDDVGIEALLRRFIENKFVDPRHVPNNGYYESSEKDFVFSGIRFKVHVGDASRVFDGEHIRECFFQNYESTDVFLCCFSFDNPRESLSSIQNKWVPEIRKYRKTTPIILVGCKSDLHNQRKFKENEINEIQTTTGCVEYVKCSAKKNKNISVVFDTVLHCYLQIRNNEEEEEVIRNSTPGVGDDQFEEISISSLGKKKKKKNKKKGGLFESSEADADADEVVSMLKKWEKN